MTVIIVYHSKLEQMEYSVTYAVLFSIFCFSIQTVLSATTCSTGYYLDGTNCYPCTPGTYCPDGFRKLECSPGQYSNSFTSSSCSSCQRGYYTTKTSSTTCNICPLGFMCPNADREPVSCPRGTYQDTYGSAQCQSCSRGV